MRCLAQGVHPRCASGGIGTRAQILRGGHQSAIALFPRGQQLHQGFAVRARSKFFKGKLRILQCITLCPKGSVTQARRLGAAIEVTTVCAFARATWAACITSIARAKATWARAIALSGPFPSPFTAAIRPGAIFSIAKLAATGRRSGLALAHAGAIVTAHRNNRLARRCFGSFRGWCRRISL